MLEVVKPIVPKSAAFGVPQVAPEELKLQLEALLDEASPGARDALLALVSQLSPVLERASSEGTRPEDFLQAAAGAHEAVTRTLLEQMSNVLEVSPETVDVFSGVLAHVMEALLRQTAGPQAEDRDLFRQQTEAAIGAFDVVVTSSEEQLSSLAELLAADEEDGETDGDETVGIYLTFALYRRIEQESIPGDQLTERLGVSRQWLQQLRKANKLFAVELPYRRSFLYPKWQFDAELRPRPELPEIIGVARGAGLSAIELHQLMVGHRSSESEPLVGELNAGHLGLVLDSLIARAEF